MIYVHKYSTHCNTVEESMYDICTYSTHCNTVEESMYDIQ